MPTAFTQTEHEVVVLKLVWDLIDEMVNYEMFAGFESVEDVALMFNSSTHQRLFNILLLDFLPQPRQWPFGLTTPAPGAPTSLAEPSISSETGLSFSAALPWNRHVHQFAP